VFRRAIGLAKSDSRPHFRRPERQVGREPEADVVWHSHRTAGVFASRAQTSPKQRVVSADSHLWMKGDPSALLKHNPDGHLRSTSAGSTEKSNGWRPECTSGLPMKPILQLQPQLHLCEPGMPFIGIDPARSATRPWRGRPMLFGAARASSDRGHC
jgi:hypothetical protein